MMRKLLYVIVLLGIGMQALAQKELPAIKVENLKGEVVDVREILKDSIPVVLSFWSTTCKPCIMELDAFAEVFEDQQEEFRYKVVAVSTDDERSASKVKALVNGRGWPFEVVLDKNQDLKRAMNVTVQPQLFILDKNGKIVYTHTGYVPQSEEAVFKKLKEIQ